MLGDDQQSRRAPTILLGIGGLIAVLALANPTWERQPSPVFKAQRAVVVALDLSQSMLTPDLLPSRLERARYKIVDLLQHNADGQTALVAYAGDAFVVAPLSDDSATLESLLAALEPSLMPVPGSRPDLALAAAGRLLSQAGVAHGEVLLVADAGGDQRALAAASELLDNGHSVAVLAVGSEQGAPLPGIRGGVQHDAAGQPVVAGLEADSLRELARAGGGRYAVISADGRDLRYLLPSRLDLDAEIEESALTTERWNPIGPWLALLLLPLAALAFRRGWLVAIAAVVMVGGGVGIPQPAMAFGWDDLWQRADQQSAQALAAGDAQQAAELADEPQRRGAAQFAAGDFAAADQSFSSAEGVDADYNQGNALAKLGRYEDAIAAYDQALSSSPAMEDALWNKQQVEQLLKQQQEQQQSQGGEGDPSQDQSQQGEQGEQGQEGQQGEQQGQDQQQSGQQSGEDGDPSQQQSQGQQGNQQGKQGDQQSDQQGEQSQQQAEGGQDGDPQQGQDAGQQSAEQDGQQAGDDRQQQAQAGEPGADGQANAAGEDADQSPQQDESSGQQQTAGSEAEAGEAGEAAQAAEAGKGDGDSNMDSEQQLAMEQWLRRIPDDPGGLLRRKFLYQYRQRGAAPDTGSAQPW